MRKLLRSLRQSRAYNKPIVTSQGARLNIGCGPAVVPGWVNVDRFAHDPSVRLHDLRNPLSAVIGYAELLENDPSPKTAKCAAYGNPQYRQDSSTNFPPFTLTCCR